MINVEDYMDLEPSGGVGELVHFQVIPDSKLDNKNVERLSNSLCNYMPIIKRIKTDGDFYVYERKNFISYEIVLKKKDVRFYFTTTKQNQIITKKALESTWHKSTIQEAAEPFVKEPDLMTIVDYHYHYMFSLRIDMRKQNGVLENLLESLNIMSDNDEVYVQVVGFPSNNQWSAGATDHYKKFLEGKMPSKVRFNKKSIARGVVKGVAKTLVGTLNAFISMTGGKAEPFDIDGNERALILKDGELRRETIQKTRLQSYETEIRIGVICDDTTRAKAISKSVAVAFREMDGDNYLEDMQGNKRTWKNMKKRSKSLKPQEDYFSTLEFSRLLALPTVTLQDLHHIPNISVVETELPPRMLEGGLLIGFNQYKGKKQNIYFPTDNHDELCLPHAVVGGMGQGKTKGHGANRVVEAVLNGFGALCLDPAKGELGDEIESFLPPDKVIRINLGERPIAIDWRETEHAIRSKNRLANTILNFFGGQDDTGGQTTRFLRASVFGMQTTNIKELLRMFEDAEYLKECVESMDAGSIHRQTLQSLLEYTDGRRRQILDPVYNRLDDIMGDEYLGECFDSNDGLDLVELLSQKKAIIIDMPKKLVGETGINLIGNLLMTKIDLAMTLREEENQFPFFVVIDEPHQFSRSKKIWKSACVESRKYRLQYTFMFHDWSQLGSDLRDIVKSSGAHFSLYPSSKKTFVDLQEEMFPLTLEDALALETHYAINILTSGKRKVKPFIMHMAKPPSQRNS